MPSIFHTSTAALTSPERFPVGGLVIDARYRTQLPPWGPPQVEALFSPGGYMFAPALGSMECSNHDFAATVCVIDFRRGLTALQGVLQAHAGCDDTL